MTRNKFIRVRYTDVHGRFLAKYILKPDAHIENFFSDGIGLDGSSVRGFADIDESDLLLFPDRFTFRPLEDISHYELATIIADVYRGSQQGRLTRDPRSTTQRVEEYLRNDGISCQVGAEVECFIFDDILFENNNNHENPDSAFKIISSEQFGLGKYPIRRKEGYDVQPFQDSLSDLRFEVAYVLTQFYRIDVTNLIHEVASNSQIEINFMHDMLARTADNVEIYKDVVRNIAKQHNRIANFMPKPIFGPNNSGNGLHSNADSDCDNGSGMHTSISLWNNSGSDTNCGKSNNVFYDESDDYAQLSQNARYFLGGILDHASSLAAIVTPTVNSYYRMVPGFEAPIYIAWAIGNRSTVIRVPVDEKNNFKSKRIEFRARDPSANPYLAFSAIVSAGLDGIKKKIDPGNPVNANVYKMSDSTRNSLGIKSLPRNLEEALVLLKTDSDYLKICFHKELIETHLILKEEEMREVGEDRSKMRQFMLYYDI